MERGTPKEDTGIEGLSATEFKLKKAKKELKYVKENIKNAKEELDDTNERVKDKKIELEVAKVRHILRGSGITPIPRR